MRIALVTHEFPSREHAYITQWVERLVRSGVDLTVITERLDAGEIAAGALPHPVRRRVRLFGDIHRPVWTLIRSVRAGLGGFRRSWIASRKECSRTRSAVRRALEAWPVAGERFDILHFNAPQIAVRRFELREILDAKVLVSFRGQDFSFHPGRYDDLLEEADHLHFISRDLARQAQAHGYAGNKHTLIPPLVDTDLFCPPSVSPTRHDFPGPFTVFTAARFEWAKGWEFALTAVALLVRRGYNITYEIAGDGSMREAIVFTAHDLGIADRVSFLGWLCPEEVRDHLTCADAYLLSSVTEGFNNSVLQAQACSCPVVCSDAGGLPENIKDGETGLLARRRDAWDLAEKLATLLENPEMRRSMGAAGRRRVLQRFDLAKNVSQFKTLYHSMIPARAAQVVRPGREGERQLADRYDGLGP